MRISLSGTVDHASHIDFPKETALEQNVSSGELWHARTKVSESSYADGPTQVGGLYGIEKKEEIPTSLLTKDSWEAIALKQNKLVDNSFMLLPAEETSPKELSNALGTSRLGFCSIL